MIKDHEAVISETYFVFKIFEYDIAVTWFYLFIKT